MVTDQNNKPAILRIEPFAGTVTIRFWDAVIASTGEAKVLRREDEEPTFYVPFDHVYFNFLEETDHREEIAGLGQVVYWRASAMNRAADDFMRSLTVPVLAALSLANHGTFDQKIARIEAVPLGGGAQGAVEM